MTKEKPSGWTAPQHLKGFSIHCCKNSQISLAFHQRRVFNLLSDGIPRTIADISADLRLSDPRSVIRDLRHKGVVVSDFWVKSEHGSRYKRYFIEPSEPRIAGRGGVMSKRDTFYFPHEYNAKDDPKCERLIWEMGMEGYGIFWTLLEVLRAQPDYTYPVANISIIARKRTKFQMKFAMRAFPAKGDYRK